MSRGKASIGTPDREKAGTPKPAKARASTPAQQRRTAAKAPPASKRSPQRTVASAAEPQAGPATLKQVAAALARSRCEDAHALIEAGRMSVAGVQALLERRIDTLREALSELRAVGKLMSHAGARETVAHVDELARGAVELTLASVREMMALASSTQREALADGLAAHLPAAEVRRDQDHALFCLHGGLEGLHALPAHHAVQHGLALRAQPEPGQLGSHLAGSGDGGTVLVGAEARALGIGLETAAIAGRAPPDQPAQQCTESMHQRHRHAGKQAKQGDHRIREGGQKTDARAWYCAARIECKLSPSYGTTCRATNTSAKAIVLRRFTGIC